MDSAYVPFAPEFQPTLSILTTVISKTPGKESCSTRTRSMSGEMDSCSIKGIPGLRTKGVAHRTHDHGDHRPGPLYRDRRQQIEVWVKFSRSNMGLHDDLYGRQKSGEEEILKIGHFLK